MSHFPQILLCDGKNPSVTSIAKKRPNQSVTAAVVNTVDGKHVSCRMVMVKECVVVIDEPVEGRNLTSHLQTLSHWIAAGAHIHVLIIGKTLEDELRLALADTGIFASIIPYDASN
jgi:hypothetical protein